MKADVDEVQTRLSWACVVCQDSNRSGSSNVALLELHLVTGGKANIGSDETCLVNDGWKTCPEKTYVWLRYT